MAILWALLSLAGGWNSSEPGKSTRPTALDVEQSSPLASGWSSSVRVEYAGDKERIPLIDLHPAPPKRAAQDGVLTSAQGFRDKKCSVFRLEDRPCSTTATRQQCSVFSNNGGGLRPAECSAYAPVPTDTINTECSAVTAAPQSQQCSVFGTSVNSYCSTHLKPNQMHSSCSAGLTTHAQSSCSVYGAAEGGKSSEGNRCSIIDSTFNQCSVGGDNIVEPKPTTAFQCSVFGAPAPNAKPSELNRCSVFGQNRPSPNDDGGALQGYGHNTCSTLTGSQHSTPACSVLGSPSGYTLPGASGEAGQQCSTFQGPSGNPKGTPMCSTHPWGGSSETAHCSVIGTGTSTTGQCSVFDSAPQATCSTYSVEYKDNFCSVEEDSAATCTAMTANRKGTCSINFVSGANQSRALCSVRARTMGRATVTAPVNQRCSGTHAPPAKK